MFIKSNFTAVCFPYFSMFSNNFTYQIHAVDLCYPLLNRIAVFSIRNAAYFVEIRFYSVVQVYSCSLLRGICEVKFQGCALDAGLPGYLRCKWNWSNNLYFMIVYWRFSLVVVKKHFVMHITALYFWKQIYLGKLCKIF